MKLRSKLLLSFLGMIFLLGVSTAFLGSYIIKRYLFDETQNQINNDLRTVRTVYHQQLEEMATAFTFVDSQDDLAVLKQSLGLDYLYFIEASRIREVKSEVVLESYQKKKSLGSSRVISYEELNGMGKDYAERAMINLVDTPKARPTDKHVLRSAMAIEYAKPFFDQKGDVLSVLFGGKIINRNDAFIDNIVDTVFERDVYEDKSTGTVTVFLDDVRIATNVRDKQGQRAIGTRVSESVYDKVVQAGEKWLARAFVVNDWYITAYAPIKNIRENIIGVIYIGILEKPFIQAERNIIFGFVSIIVLASLVAVIFSIVLSNTLARPLTEMLSASRRISEGNLDSKVHIETGVKEIRELTDSFNEMAEKLVERDKRLEASKEQLSEINRSYLDLIGFVSHELKGILSSIVLNTYLLENQILGSINEKQEKALKAMAKNLDYLTVTVKNFLNLSRLEKAELKIAKSELLLKEHVFDISKETFMHQADEKGMEITNDIEENAKISGDAALFQIVVNNLLTNAIKYGKEQGRIILSSKRTGDAIEVEVYNDGKPIAEIDKDKLFKKFSRIVYTGMEKVKGSGIGLYITKEIIEKHGGEIWAEPREKGNAFIFRIKAL